jgi:hypothetical protein
VSASIFETVAQAAGTFPSFALAAEALKIAQIPLSVSRVERLARELGEEMQQQRDQKVIQRRQRLLPPRSTVIPEAVVAELDGGRCRTRAADQEPGVYDAKNQETKVACFATLQSTTFAEDPCPEPPAGFLKSRRVKRLVHQMKGQAGGGESPENSEEIEKPVESKEPIAKVERQERWSPKKKIRTCVASMVSSEEFGPMMAAEAQERHFYESPKRAFVSDGAAYNWTIHQGYFRDFEPILDFLHVICYVFGATRVLGLDEKASWQHYERWMRSCWQGRVDEVLLELDQWQARIGESPPGEGVTEAEKKDPRRVLHRARTYLRNNAERMDYPRYRQEGLPTTSSLAESLVGQVNTRVKSKQKYWSRGSNAESILQLRAAVLSEDDRLERFFQNRKGCPTRKTKLVA